MMVTPFHQVPSVASQGSGSLMEHQPLVSGDPEAEMVAVHGLSVTPHTVLPRSLPGVPVPVGLSDKEIARLRTEALSSQYSHNSTSNVSLTTSPGNAASDSSGATSYDPRRLHTEVEFLRREVELLRTEGMAPGAPPSYTEGDQ